MNIKKILVFLFAAIYLSASFISATNAAPIDQESAPEISQIQESIILGDANSDGSVNPEDVDYLIDYIFNHGPAPNPLFAGDVNGDGSINVADAVYLINALYGEVLKGDANSDGKVDIDDANFLVDYIFKYGKAPRSLIEGDANGDNSIDISDAVWIIDYVNSNDTCLLGDVNDDGEFNLADVYYMIDYIFNHGPEPVHFYSGDYNQDGGIDISDVVAMVNALYEEPAQPDTTAPIITLNGPIHGKSYTVDSGEEKEIRFTFAVEDNSPINSCSLVIDDRVKKTLSNVNKGVEQLFEYDLDKGSYEWQIKCEDASGNIGYSEIRDFKIKEDSSSSDSTSSTDYDALAYRQNTNTENSGDEIFQTNQNTISLNPENKDSGFKLGILQIVLIILIVIALIVIILAFVFR